MLFASIGLKKSFKVCWKYPALVLTPVFGTWTFGPVRRSQSLSNCCTTPNERISINVSFFHTWINYAITLAGSAAFFVAEVESYDCLNRYEYPCYSGLKGKQSKYSGFFKTLYDTMANGEFSFLGSNRGLITRDNYVHSEYTSYIFTSWFILLVFLPIFIGILQGVEKCCCCLYEPCQIKCFPVIQKTKLSVENMDFLENGEENNDEESIV